MNTQQNNNATVQLTDDARIDLVAARILQQYKEAFEELAK